MIMQSHVLYHLCEPVCTYARMYTCVYHCTCIVEVGIVLRQVCVCVGGKCCDIHMGHHTLIASQISPVWDGMLQCVYIYPLYSLCVCACMFVCIYVHTYVHVCTYVSVCVGIFSLRCQFSYSRIGLCLGMWC